MKGNAVNYEMSAEVCVSVGSLEEARLLSAAIVAALRTKLDILNDGLESGDDGKLYVYCAGDVMGEAEWTAMLEDVAIAQGVTLAVTYDHHVGCHRHCLYLGPQSAQVEANQIIARIERDVACLVQLGADQGQSDVSLLTAMEGHQLDAYAVAKVIWRYVECYKGK